MTRHKSFLLITAATSALILILFCYARPGLAQPPSGKARAQKAPSVSADAGFKEAQKAGADLRQISPDLRGKGAPAAQAVGGTDTLFNCTWSAATVYPITILDQATTSLGSFIYSFGGVSTSIIANAYKFDGTTWTPIANLPGALEFPSAVSDGTNIFVMGGAEPTAGTPQTTNNMYDPVANTYTPKAPFTTGTWNHAAVYLAGKVYKFCGTGPATNSTNATEIYDVASNTWSAGPAYPISTSFISGWTNGTFIYGAGGITAPGSVVQTKTYRLDPANLGAGWVDAAIADLPVSRWGAATAFYTDAVLAGGYVNGAATANISNTAISYDVATDTWQTLPNMLGERSRMTGAVLGNSFYVIGGRSVASPSFAGTNNNQKLLCLNTPTNILGAGGRTIDSAGPNGVPDPSEAVSVSLGVLNVGGPGTVCTTPALTGTLLAGGGVTGPSGPQNFGSVCTANPAVFRSFNFTVDPSAICGDTITATMHMMDGATDYGNLTYTFTIGSQSVSFSENFDAVVAPALPASWTADQGTNAGAFPLWVTSNAGTPAPPADSVPNAVFSQDPANLLDNRINSPVVMYSAGAQLTFRHNFDLEEQTATVGYDAGVLEININGAGYVDIVTAGGSFASGGYNHTGINTGFANPLLPSRPCWSGNSAGFVSVVANLPAAGAGQPCQLRWRMGSDNSVSRTGWRVDNVAILQKICGGSAPAVSSAVSRKVHGAFTGDVNLPQVALTGAVGIECRRGVVGEHQVVVTFANPVTVGSASVTAGSIGSSSVVGNVVTLNLTGVANAQRLGISLTNVSDGVNLGSVMIPAGILLGDVGGNNAVNASDVGVTKPRIGQVIDGTNFRSDVNTNAAINGGDVSLIKSVIGTALP